MKDGSIVWCGRQNVTPQGPFFIKFNEISICVKGAAT